MHVFTTDSNQFLMDVMDGDGFAQGMPFKGEVQLLVGTPPCQAFSGMNKFNAGEFANFQHSHIASYLSYCEYYRPNYLILDNVGDFVFFKKSLVLKLTLRCLLAMGYQATFGVIQAGHYGVPQSHRRLIIFAAAPGYELPNYPEPCHVLRKMQCESSVQVGDHRYTNGTRWIGSAPLRPITVYDALADLPAIQNGASMRILPYDTDAITHFQRQMRNAGGQLNTISDHICKNMPPLVEARMSYIPLAPGSDWRDLPNLEVRLKDGSYTNTLHYAYHTKQQANCETPRGVCICATEEACCDPSDQQLNTLIPWCLPHTADRHNHWTGLYGRLEWDGVFSTTVTNPEPMGRQGRVLHPEQHRVVSVRECARSQGFPDKYEFAGNIFDKHRQVGNAMPPPVGAALGREILQACLNSKV